MTNELRQMIDGNINIANLAQFTETLDELTDDLINTGFEYDEIREYFIEILNEKLGHV